MAVAAALRQPDPDEQLDGEQYAENEYIDAPAPEPDLYPGRKPRKSPAVHPVQGHLVWIGDRQPSAQAKANYAAAYAAGLHVAHRLRAGRSRGVNPKTA